MAIGDFRNPRDRALWDRLNTQQAGLWKSGRDATPEYESIVDQMEPIAPEGITMPSFAGGSQAPAQPIDYAALAEQARTGRIASGNIDMSTRPRVKNPDGSVSTVRSISANIDGREVLIPTVSDDGRILSNDDAIENYKRTGKHLGMFDSPDQATAYAQQLHESEAAKLDAPKPVDYAALADQARKQAQNDAVLYDPNRRPVSAEDFMPKPVPLANPSAGYYGGAFEVAKGAVKGLGHTAETLGQLVHKIPGVSTVMDAAYGTPGISKDAFQVADQVTAPTNTLQKVGSGLEQIGEFLLPGAAGEKTAAAIAAKAAPYFTNAPRLVQGAVKLAPRMGTEAAKSAAVTTAQGGDPLTGAAFGAVGPVVGASITGAGKYLGAKAEALVLSAVKPTVASLRRIAGASVTGLEAQATKMARFILDTGATSPEKARAILTSAEAELQRVLSAKNAPTDAAERSVRYLAALERSASKQGLPAADVATIRNAAAEILEGSMGKDVVTMVPGPHPTLVGPNGQPITVLQPQTTRVLRTDIMADEALSRARANSQWDTKKAWGEQKGAQMESSKAVERAQRDAVKIAVPETRPILQRQGQAITTITALDRMAQRTGNRDALSLPGVVATAAELAGGKPPVIGMAAQWLRNNQMKAGVWADSLAKAIARKDVQEIGAILNKLGVGATAQTGR